MKSLQQALDDAALGYRVDQHKGLMVYKLKNTNANIGMSPMLCLFLSLFEISPADFWTAQKEGRFPPFDFKVRDEEKDETKDTEHRGSKA